MDFACSTVSCKQFSIPPAQSIKSGILNRAIKDYCSGLLEGNSGKEETLNETIYGTLGL